MRAASSKRARVGAGSGLPSTGLGRSAQCASRRVLGALALGVAIVTATFACAAGQVAETANIAPAAAGSTGSIGAVALRNVGIVAPANGSYPVGGNAQLTFTAVNSADTPDTLVAVTTTAARSVKLSSAAGNGIALTPMVAVESYRQDGPEVVLTGLTRSLRSGESVPVTFTFAGAGEATVQVAVAAPITEISPAPGTPPPNTEK